MLKLGCFFRYPPKKKFLITFFSFIGNCNLSSSFSILEVKYSHFLTSFHFLSSVILLRRIIWSLLDRILTWQGSGNKTSLVKEWQSLLSMMVCYNLPIFV